MRKAAQSAFYPEMLALEAARGPISWIYADSRGLPTTGIGSLLGTTSALSAATLEMPWRFKSRDWATQAQKQAEWHRVAASGIKGDGYAYESSAVLFLDQEDVRRDFDHRASAMEAQVARFLPNWSTLRADAQLAAMSMVWNLGANMFNPSSGAYWPNLTAALKAKDYLRASDNCLINGHTSERNRRNRKMFLQCVRADLFAADPDQLFGGVVKVSANAIPNGNPDKPGSNAFWAQVLLREAKTYTGPLDGLFGSMSLAAWKAATGETTPSLTGLTKLCDASKGMLGIEAGA